MVRAIEAGGLGGGIVHTYYTGSGINNYVRQNRNNTASTQSSGSGNTSLLSGLGNFFGSIGGDLSGIGSTVVNDVRGLPSDLQKPFADLFTAVGDVEKQLQSSLTAIPSDMDTYLQNKYGFNFGTLGSIVSDVENLPSDFNTLITDVKNLPSNISNDISTLHNDIGTVLTQIEAIPNDIKTGFSNLGSMLNTDVVAPIGNLISSSLQSFYTEYISPFLNKVDSSFSTLYSFLQSLPSTISNDLKNALASFVSDVQTAFGNFLTATENFLSVMESKILSAVQSVYSHIDSALVGFYNTYIAPAFSYIETNFFDPIYNALKTVYNDMKTVYNDIVAFVGKAGDVVSFVKKYWLPIAIGVAGVAGVGIYIALYPDIELGKIAQKVGVKSVI